MRPVARLTLFCTVCGRSYERTAAQLRSRPSSFCSKQCKHDGQRKVVEVTCTGCGRGFVRKASEVTTENFCTRRCYDGYRREHATSYLKIGARHIHRLVAERKLGRPLRWGEVAHHKDEDKHNNAEENIEVLPSLSAHARIHHPKGRRVGSV